MSFCEISLCSPYNFKAFKESPSVIPLSSKIFGGSLKYPNLVKNSTNESIDFTPNFEKSLSSLEIKTSFSLLKPRLFL